MTDSEIEAIRSIRDVLGRRLLVMAKNLARNPAAFTNDQFGLIGTIDLIDGILDKWTRKSASAGSSPGKPSESSQPRPLLARGGAYLPELQDKA